MHKIFGHKTCYTIQRTFRSLSLTRRISFEIYNDYYITVIIIYYNNMQNKFEKIN